MDYIDYWNEETNERRKRPKSFTFKVNLPKVKKIKEITNLEIIKKEFILEVAGKYYLDLKMPLPVLSEQGKAKFDSKTKILKVTMQVDR